MFQSPQHHAPSGLASFPTIHWGSHVAQLYHSPSDLEDALVPYFRAGLLNNERCLWVTDTPLVAEKARASLRAFVPDLDEREHAGQIEIQDGAAFYDRTLPLAPRTLVDGLLQRESAAIASGFNGLRTNGNCGWVQKQHWDGFRDYEALVQKDIKGRRLICMCSFDSSCFGATRVHDLLGYHDAVFCSDALGESQAGRRTDNSSAGLDEEFLAILSHDLRNPIAAITAGVTLLKKLDQTDRGKTILDAMGQSANRMEALVNDIMDLTRGRLGNGLVLNKATEGLEAALLHAVDELRMVHPGREIEVTVDLASPVRADSAYLSRLLSNLLKNALAYGAEQSPVHVLIESDRDFVIAVTNHGDPIPLEAQEQLFAPFTRGAANRSDQRGLGLGLYIVSEIARAHGGVIEISSNDDFTRFTFRMPLP